MIFFKKRNTLKLKLNVKNMGAPYNFSSGGANKKKKSYMQPVQKVKFKALICFNWFLSRTELPDLHLSASESALFSAHNQEI